MEISTGMVMAMRAAAIVGVVMGLGAGSVTANSPELRNADMATEAIRGAGQLVVVTTAEWQSTSGQLRRHQRAADGTWSEVGDVLTVVTGKNGLAWGVGLHGDLPAGEVRKREGDGKSPAGLFDLGPVFGYAAETAAAVQSLKMPYSAAGSDTVCVDDPGSESYNRLTERQVGNSDAWKSAEKMRRHDELYRWGVVVEHNTTPAEPGAGSCIFLHIWRAADRPTVGCTALEAGDVEVLINWLDHDRRPLLVQLPRLVYEQKREAWGLP